MNKLTAQVEIPIRFSEVDSMGIVWHGSYAAYFEEAREAFGVKYNLGYLTMFGKGYYAPLVELNFSYKEPIPYGTKIMVEIEYIPSDAAKIIFNYRIYDLKTKRLTTTGTTTQVFLNKEYQLEWNNPEFYQQWKADNNESSISDSK